MITGKTLEYYKRLPYTLHTEPQKDEDGSNYWTAEYMELMGCKTDGLTESDAVNNLYELFDDYISAMIEENAEIVEPAPQIILEGEWIDVMQNWILFPLLLIKFPKNQSNVPQRVESMSSHYEAYTV